MNSFEIRITVITSTWNCASSLAVTAASIRLQTHPSIQWIVVDGASSDGTLDVIQSNLDIVTQWISEPDSGIYDAWNKACVRIDGDWVLFLGAGDYFPKAESLEQVASKLAHLSPNILIAYGNVSQFSGGVETFRYERVNLSGWEQYRPVLPAHQGIFHRAQTLAHDLPFDSSYKVVADSKFLLQLIRPEVTFYLDLEVCIMEPDGISSSPRYAIAVMREFFRLEKDLGYKIPKELRLWYAFKTYAKVIMLRCLGGNILNFLTKIKRYSLIHLR